MHRSIPRNLWSKLQDQAADALGEEFWEDMAAIIPQRTPRVDVYLQNDEVVAVAELPGVRDEADIRVKISTRTIELKGELKPEAPGHEDDYLVHERFEGAFTRKLDLTLDILPETAAAHYEKGLLTITVKKKPEEEAKELAVRFDGKSKKSANPKEGGTPEASDLQDDEADMEPDPGNGSWQSKSLQQDALMHNWGIKAAIGETIWPGNGGASDAQARRLRIETSRDDQEKGDGENGEKKT